MVGAEIVNDVLAKVVSMSSLEKRVRAIFKGLRLVQYDEGNEFVEFWITSDDTPGPYVTIQQLQKLIKLLGSEVLKITGGDIGNRGCDSCAEETPAIYVLVEGVKFR